MVVDIKMSLIDSYTEENPQLVWFKNGVYNIEQDLLFEHNSKYYLKQHHNYSLPINVNDEKSMSLGELEMKCQTILKRLELLVGDASDYFITLLGYGFMHTYKPWNVMTFLFDRYPPTGKSFFISTIIHEMFGYDGFQCVNMKDMRRNNKELMAMSGCEMNVLAEFGGLKLTENVVNTLKNIVTGNHVKYGYKYVKHLNIYSKILTSSTNSIYNMGEISNLLNNDELTSHIVVIPTTGDYPKNGEFRSIYTEKALKAEIPYFSLYCMKMFNKHLQNNTFKDFKPDDENNPLITSEMIKTRNYLLNFNKG